MACRISSKIVPTLLILSSLFFLFSCQSDPPPQKREKQRAVDNTPPILDRVTPENHKRLSGPIANSLQISGVLRDKSGIAAVTLDGKNIAVSRIDAQRYSFSVNVPLQLGENEFILQARDSAGNILETSLVYFNGKALRVILEPERKELPPGGRTFFEAFLEEDDGQKTPLSIEDVELHAQRGYFKGAEYRAPSNSGTDTISAKYKAKNARGTIKIRVLAPKVKIAINGPQNIRRGQDTRFSVTVENIGQTEAIKNRIVVQLPDRVRFRKAENGRFISTVSEIHWDIGELGPGIDHQVEFVIQGEQISSCNLLAIAQSSGENVGEQAFTLKISGEVQATYTADPRLASIEQMLKTDLLIVSGEDVSNVEVECEFPDECKYVDSNDGSNSPGQLAGRKVAFPPLGKLSEGQQASFSVKTLVKRYGELKFIATVRYQTTGGKTKVVQKELVVPTQ